MLVATMELGLCSPHMVAMEKFEGWGCQTPLDLEAQVKDYANLGNLPHRLLADLRDLNVWQLQLGLNILAWGHEEMLRTCSTPSNPGGSLNRP